MQLRHKNGENCVQKLPFPAATDLHSAAFFLHSSGHPSFYSAFPEPHFLWPSLSLFFSSTSQSTNLMPCQWASEEVHSWLAGTLKLT